jgi:hypothetical protein
VVRFPTIAVTGNGVGIGFMMGDATLLVHLVFFARGERRERRRRQYYPPEKVISRIKVEDAQETINTKARLANTSVTDTNEADKGSS